MLETIGTNAGKIWSHLSESNDITLSALKKDLNLKGDEAGLALGWLAKEGKIEFGKKGASIKVKLLN
ncbi:MAG: winged helix-turn-helix domain-containing protein [Candidatus Gastranaerophilaceae bacterium]|jgi:hypothetical protein